MLVLGRENSIVLLAMVSVPLMLGIFWQNRRQVHWLAALEMSVPAVVLTPLLVYLFRFVDESYLLVAAGIGILVCVVGLFRGIRIAALRGRIGAVIAGAVSSVLNGLSGSGGPPPAIYAVNANWTPEATRGTLQVLFMIMSLVTGLSLGIPDVSIETSVVVIGATLVGMVSGMLAAKRIRQDTARKAILSLAGLGGMVLVVSGVIEIALAAPS